MRCGRLTLLLALTNLVFAEPLLNIQKLQQRDAGNSSSLASPESCAPWTDCSAISTYGTTLNSTSATPGVVSAPQLQPTTSSFLVPTLGPQSGPGSSSSNGGASLTSPSLTKANSTTFGTAWSPHVMHSATSLIGPAMGPSRVTKSAEVTGAVSEQQSLPNLGITTTTTGSGNGQTGDHEQQATALRFAYKPDSGSTGTSDLIATPSSEAVQVNSGAAPSSQTEQVNSGAVPSSQAGQVNSGAAPSSQTEQVHSGAVPSSQAGQVNSGAAPSSQTEQVNSGATPYTVLEQSSLPNGQSTIVTTVILVVQTTTITNGKAAASTYAAGFPSPPASQPNAYDSGAAPYTVLQQSTLPSGTSTVVIAVTTVITLAKPVSSGGSVVTIGGEIFEANPASASGAVILGTGTTLAAYSTSTDAQGRAQIVTVTPGAGTTVGGSSGTTSSSQAQRSGSATSSIAVQLTSGAADDGLRWSALFIAVICVGALLL